MQDVNVNEEPKRVISYGAIYIARERERQIFQEKFTTEHDSNHTRGELALAASAYARPQSERYFIAGTPVGWPFEDSMWKPTPDNRIRECVKAGALLAAEIDRLIREKEKEYAKTRENVDKLVHD